MKCLSEEVNSSTIIDGVLRLERLRWAESSGL